MKVSEYKKPFFCLLSFFAGIVFLQTVYFGYVLSISNSLKHSDLIAVFTGGRGRVEAGVKLHAAGFGKHLVISSMKESQVLEMFPKIHKSMIIESQARTTFENALYTRNIILKNELRSVILVTSDFHASRSYFLLKAMLIGKGVNLSLFKVNSEKDRRGFSDSSLHNFKVVYNEMVKLWGSLGELTVYKINGRVLDMNPKQDSIIQFIKSILLFDI